jgi:hypothetical protein
MSNRPTPTTLTFGEMRHRIRRPRRIVPLVLDAEADAEVAQLTALLERAMVLDRATGEHTAREVAQLLQTAEYVADSSRVELVLQAVPHTLYRKLREQNPPTREQLDRAARLGAAEPVFDADAMAAALVRAQLLSPAPESDEAFDGFWSELSDGNLQALWTTAIAVQFQHSEPPAPNAAAAELTAARTETSSTA